jgi:hypothetical protein
MIPFVILKFLKVQHHPKSILCYFKANQESFLIPLQFANLAILFLSCFRFEIVLHQAQIS